MAPCHKEHGEQLRVGLWPWPLACHILSPDFNSLISKRRIMSCTSKKCFHQIQSETVYKAPASRKHSVTVSCCGPCAVVLFCHHSRSRHGPAGVLGAPGRRVDLSFYTGMAWTPDRACFLLLHRPTPVSSPVWPWKFPKLSASKIWFCKLRGGEFRR